MTGYEQIRRGTLAYISREIVPILGTGKGILVEAFAPALLDANLKKLMGSELVTSTGLVDGASADVDEIYKLVKAAAAGKWPVELMGVRFSETDLDKLYRHIKEG